MYDILSLRFPVRWWLDGIRIGRWFPGMLQLPSYDQAGASAVGGLSERVTVSDGSFICDMSRPKLHNGVII